MLKSVWSPTFLIIKLFGIITKVPFFREGLPRYITQPLLVFIPCALVTCFVTVGGASAHLFDEEMITRLGPFMAGISHPVLGADHFLAMFSVGLVSAIMAGRHFWLVPVTFVATMPVGWLLGRWSVPFPPVEIGIATSVFALGVAALWAKRLPVAIVYSAVAIFALFHGYAHGQETPEGVDLRQYAAGFMAGTAGIHILGLFAGDILNQPEGRNLSVKVLASALMGSGALFLAQAIGSAASGG